MVKRSKLLAMLLLLALALACLAGCGAAAQEKCTLYVGLNDATTGEQVVSLEAAQEVARGIITDRGFGYTERVAYGAYPEDGVVKSNDTLVYDLPYVPKADAVEIADLIKAELSLASVLIEEDTSVYYLAD